MPLDLPPNKLSKEEAAKTLKVYTDTEKLWKGVKDKATEHLKNLNDEIEINKALLLIAEQKLKEEERKRKT